MNHVATIFLTFLLGWSTLCLSQKNYIDNQVIILLQNSKNIDKVIEFGNQLNPQLDLKLKRVLSERASIYLLEYGNSNVNAPKISQLLKDAPNVALTQVNHNNIKRRSIVPNDQYLPIQWSLQTSAATRIYAQEAWEYTTDNISAHGDTIVMAVVDGGADLSHEDLNWFKNRHEIPNNGIDDDNNGYIDDYHGWNAYNQDGNLPIDDHAAHVAGIMGAKTDNAEGIAGIVWAGSILPVAASSGVESVVLEGYGYVLEQRLKYDETNGDSGAFIVCTNSSFGVDFADPDNYPIWCAFYDSLGAAGILNLGATSNVNVNIDAVGDVPTACPSNHMIAVANVAQSGQISGGYGVVNVDIAAPGTSIYATVPPNSSYSFKSGTSMATPHVSAVVGAMFSAICEEDLTAYKQNPDSFALLIRDSLLANVTTLSILNNQVATGGSLNMLEAVKSVIDNNCLSTRIENQKDACANCAGAIRVTPNGSYPPFISRIENNLGDSVGDSTALNLCQGTYYSVITDKFGKTKTDTILLEKNQQLAITFDNTSASNINTLDGEITANVTGGEPTYNYLWNNGDTTQTISNLGTGLYVVTITDINDCTYSDSSNIFTVGIQHISSLNTKVYPNPVNQIINISSGGEPITKVSVYTISGQLIQEHNMNPALEHKISLNLKKGAYLLIVNTKEHHQIMVN